jgi:predicted transcriptional regulator
MTSPAVTVRSTETVTRVARLMDAARVKRVPVVDEAGHLVGIVSRRDLVRMYTRSDPEVRAAACEGVLRSLWIDPADLGIEVRAGIVTLSGHLDRRSIAEIVVAFVKATPGVVDVVDRLSWDLDDKDGAVADGYRAIPVRH